MLSANWAPLQSPMLHLGEPLEGIFSRGPVPSALMAATAAAPHIWDIAGPGRRAGGLVMLPCAKTVVARKPTLRIVEVYILTSIKIRLMV